MTAETLSILLPVGALLALQLLPPTPVPVALGPGAQILLKLIDQLPSILTAAGVLAGALVGLLNYRRLGAVKEQNDGHMTAMLAKQSEMATQLANSVPSAALTAVAALATTKISGTAPLATNGAEASLTNINADTSAIKQNTAKTDATVQTLKDTL